MAGQSAIEWTEHTWNPVTGCTKVSPGCKHCYAEALARRLERMGTPGYENGFGVSLMADRLDAPKKRRKPTNWFVNSMSDLFHEEVPFDFIEKIVQTIWDTPQHNYQILTKRPLRMVEFFDSRKVPANAWLGTSVEDKKYGMPRIPILKRVDAEVRFLSIEPLLENLGKINLHGIHWVIVGGESGPNARPISEDWVLSVRDQCVAAGVPFFFKQWGGHTPKAGGRKLQGHTWDGKPVIDDDTKGLQVGV